MGKVFKAQIRPMDFYVTIKVPSYLCRFHLSETTTYQVFGVGSKKKIHNYLKMLLKYPFPCLYISV